MARFESKHGYIDIPDEAMQGKKTLWSDTVGKHLYGVYKNNKFDILVLGYYKENCELYFNFNEKEGCHIKINQIKRLNGFDILFDIKSFEFKYEIGQRIVDYKDDGTLKRDFVIIDRKKEKDERCHSWKYYKIHCNICGFNSGKHYYNGIEKDEYWITENPLINGQGCGCCSGQFCVTGINDMWTTNPKLSSSLSDKDDGYKYMQNTQNKLNFICQYCGNINSLYPRNVEKRNKIPCNCGDGISYPEKFMYSVLTQIGVDFIWQYSKTNCNWIKDNKKYDFYFNYNHEQYIIETHGEQHYKISFIGVSDRARTLKEEQENDMFKKELAISNVIKEENYIIIDCRKSELEYIKDNIIHSRLNDLFDLSKVDWIKCGEYACKNIYKEICDIWNSLPTENKSTETIYKTTRFGHGIILNALKKGHELGLCEFDTTINYKNDIYLKVTDLNDKLLGVYRGYTNLQNASYKQFGKYFDHKRLFDIYKKHKLNQGKGISGNLKFSKTNKDYYEENKNICVKYLYKNKYPVAYKNDKVYYFKNCKQCADFINNVENVNTKNSSVSNAISKNKTLYGYSIKYEWFTEEEIEKLNSNNKNI